MVYIYMHVMVSGATNNINVLNICVNILNRK